MSNDSRILNQLQNIKLSQDSNEGGISVVGLFDYLKITGYN